MTSSNGHSWILMKTLKRQDRCQWKACTAACQPSDPEDDSWWSIIICPITNHTAQQREKKQWNRTEKANSSYSRRKKQKNENESDCNKYQQIKLTIYTTDLHAYTQFHANKMYEHIERNMKTQENWWMSRHLRSFRLADEAISYQLL